MKGGRLVALIGGLLTLFGVMANWVMLSQSGVLFIRGLELLQGKVIFFILIIALLIIGIYKGNPGETYSIVLGLIGSAMAGYLYTYGGELSKWSIAGNIKNIQIIPQGGFYMTIIGSVLIALGGYVKIPGVRND